MTEEVLIEKLAVYLATERSKVGVYPASQIARQVISMVRERDRQRRAMDELIAGDADLYELSAAPSPDGGDDEVERVARALCVDDDVDPDAVGYDRTGRDLPNWYVVQGTARAAISAMRHTLSEEDRARVEEIRKRITAIRDAMLDRRGPTLGDLVNAEQALSLIDKLTEAG